MVLPDFHHKSEVLFGCCLQAMSSASFKSSFFSYFFHLGSLFGKKLHQKEHFCFRFFM